MLSTSVRITLFIIALILFIFGGIRMRTKTKQEMSLNAIRFILFIIFFVIMVIACQFLNIIPAIIVVLIDIAACYAVIYKIYKSKS